MIDPLVEPNLFVQTAFLGDLALSVPALKQIKKMHPDRPLWLVCRKGVGDFLLDFKLVDRVFQVKKRDSNSYKTVFAELGSHRFHWIVCPHESLTTARWVYGLNASKKFAFRKFWNKWLFSDRILKVKQWPEAIRQLSLLRSVSGELTQELANFSPEDLIKPSLPLMDPPAWCKMDLLRKPAEKFVVIFPGSVWLTKKWTEMGFAELIQKFLKEGFAVELMGSEQEFAECERLRSANPRIQNLAGKLSLTEGIQRMASSSLVVSNDSGGSHLGALAGVPVLSIFGPTVIEQGFRPWSDHSGTIWLDGLQCRPCGAHGHQQCPLQHHDCMRKLQAQTVFESALKILR